MRYLTFTLLLATSTVFAADAGPYALIILHASGKSGVPVSVNMNFTEVGRALTTPAFVEPAKLVVAEEQPGGKLTPVLGQFDPAPDFDARKHAAGTLSLVLPPGAPGDRRVRVYFTGLSPRLEAPSVPAQLKITQDQGRITVANACYAFTHDPTKLGGLPSKIEWPATGKVFDSFSLNDRVYNPVGGSYVIHDDKSPEVKLIVNGPVRAVVQVRARYMREGQQPRTKPVAVYEFVYYVGSPIVRVSAHATQDEPLSWGEHHFLEINFPDQSFTKYAYGEPFVEGQFKADKKGIGPFPWGALSDGKNVLGLLGCGAQFYDGRGEYGTYMHGSWANWQSSERDFVGYLWVNTVGDYDELRATAGTIHAGTEALVTTQPLLDKLAAIRAKIAKLPAGPRRGRFAWVADQIDRAASVRGEIAASWVLANQLGSALVAGKDAYDAVPWKLKVGAPWTARGLAMVDNGQIGVGFDRTDTGAALVSLYDFASERELLSGVPTAFWSVDCEARGAGPETRGAGVPPADNEPRGAAVPAAKAAGTESLTLDSLTGWGQVRTRKAAGADNPILIEFADPARPQAAGVAATVRLAFTGARATWKLSIANKSLTLSLRDIYFPRVQLGKIGPSAEDDACTVPRGSGELVAAPLAKAFGGFSGWYPSGWCSMQFMCHWDADCGIYVATHDPVACAKSVQVDRVDSGLNVRMQWFAPDRGLPGNSFEQSGDAALQTFRGDWFDATQIYKEWARKEAKWWPKDEDRKDTPKWMHDTPVWANSAGGPAEVVDITRKFGEYMKQAPSEPDMPVAVHWYAWHKIPFDVNYPHYFPVKDGFKEGVQALQKAGIRVMPYINGRLWDSALDDFKSDGIKGAAKDEKGKPYIEEYGSGAKLAPMCPTTKIWQSKVQEIVMRLVSEYGVDGVYIDQVAAAWTALCYDKSHGHTLGGGDYWTAGGYWPLLTELRRQMKVAGLEKFLTTECNAEPYINCFDGYLTWHFQYPNQIPMFASIYAGRIQPFSRSYSGDETAQCMKAGQQLVFGEQLGWCDPHVVNDRPTFVALLRDCARIRYAERDCLAYGDMARPPVLKGDMPTITADWEWGGKMIVTTDALLAGAWKSRDGARGAGQETRSVSVSPAVVAASPANAGPGTRGAAVPAANGADTGGAGVSPANASVSPASGKLAVIFVNVTDKPVQSQWVFNGAQYGFASAKRLKLALRTETGISAPETVAPKFTRALDVPAHTAWAFEVTPE